MTEHLPSSGRLRAFRRVVLRDGVVEHAGNEPGIGYIGCEGISYGDGQPVHLREPGGAAVVALSGDEVKAGAELFAAEQGKVSEKGDVLEGTAASDSADGLVVMQWANAEAPKKKGK